VARKFTSMECGVFASPAYLAARGTPRQPLDLPAHACLRYGNVERHAEYGFLTEEGVLPVPVVGPITSNDGGALVALAEQGAGVVVVPWFLAHDAVRAGRLVRILPEARLSSVAGHAVHAHGRHAPARVRAFVDAVVDAFRAPPWGSLS
jgi:DNA-binding transcriptional LysR family regulator